MVSKKLATLGILTAVALAMCVYAIQWCRQMNTRQTIFSLYTKERSSGIARLRYTQSLTITLLSDTEFRTTYTAKTSEDLRNEEAQLILSPGLMHVDGALRWEGDLQPEKLLILTVIAEIREDGRFRVTGTIGFSYADIAQTEHSDLYVVVEDGKIVDVTLESGATAPTPEQAVERA